MMAMKHKAVKLTDEILKSSMLDFFEKKRFGELPFDTDMCFRAILYLGFREGWFNGLRWGWAQYNLELNNSINERINRALDLAHPVEGFKKKRTYPPLETGVPKVDVFFESWVSEVKYIIQGIHEYYISKDHPDHPFAIDLEDKESYVKELIGLYKNHLVVAWQAGWDCGVELAKEKVQERNESLKLFDEANKYAEDLERGYLENHMDLMLKKHYFKYCSV